MSYLFRLITVLDCPSCGARMYRDGKSHACEHCHVVARVDLGAWRYPLESAFRHRLPGARGMVYDERRTA